MTKRTRIDIESFLDNTEPDTTLRSINWCVDVYIYTDQLSKAIQAKWARANHLLGVR